MVGARPHASEHVRAVLLTLESTQRRVPGVPTEPTLETARSMYRLHEPDPVDLGAVADVCLPLSLDRWGWRRDRRISRAPRRPPGSLDHAPRSPAGLARLRNSIERIEAAAAKCSSILRAKRRPHAPSRVGFGVEGIRKATAQDVPDCANLVHPPLSRGGDIPLQRGAPCSCIIRFCKNVKCRSSSPRCAGRRPVLLTPQGPSIGAEGPSVSMYPDGPETGATAAHRRLPA